MVGSFLKARFNWVVECAVVLFFVVEILRNCGLEILGFYLWSMYKSNFWSSLLFAYDSSSSSGSSSSGSSSSGSSSSGSSSNH